MGQRLQRLLIVLAGIIVGQFILYGPSLVGRKILLPLDLLSGPGVYLPRTPETAKIEPQDTVLSDLVFLMEPARRFIVSEFHAGRFPMWLPYQHAGVPLVWLKLSPFQLLEYCTASPVVLAWVQLVTAVIAGVGIYLFCRRVLAVGFWPAAVVAWCYPLTGFFVFWQGYPLGAVVAWFPWLMLAVDKTARRAHRAAPTALSVITALLLTSGQLDIDGQVLLASGLFALWCLWDAYPQQWFQSRARKAIVNLVAGWMLGFFLASPHILPLVEYTQTGSRMARRSGGGEERPPVGLSALPQTVLPDCYGSTARGSLFIPPAGRGNVLESASATYAGVVATLLVAPFAWCSRRHRAVNVFWAFLALFALSWCLDLPGLVDLLRLPVLNMMSHNRLVFVATFAILAMTAVGLEVLLNQPIQWRWWLWLPTAVLVVLCAGSVYWAVFLPEPIATQLEESIRNGRPVAWISQLGDVRQVQAWFVRHYAVAAALCGLGVAGGLMLRFRNAWQARLVPALTVVMIADLLWFAHDRRPQCDPALYYPRIPVLESVARSTPGRVIGYNCLPASLSAMCGLQDIRGCDGVDPARLMDLMMIAADPRSIKFAYSETQWMTPIATNTAEGFLRLPPVLDMLNVRYLIFRGTPPPDATPDFQGGDYWVLVNPAVLPRAFVPRRVESVTDDDARVQKLASPQFDPREVAFVETAVNLPVGCRGAAEIVSEIPTHLTMSVRMETPGLVVLADLWDKGWRAYLNGKPAPILRTNHALRGVVAPAGSATLDFRYEPASFSWGLRLAAFAATVLLVWCGWIVWVQRIDSRAGQVLR